MTPSHLPPLNAAVPSGASDMAKSDKPVKPEIPAGSRSYNPEFPLKAGLATIAIAGIFIILALAWHSGSESTQAEASDDSPAEASAEASERDTDMPPGRPTSRPSRWAVSIQEAEKCVLMARTNDRAGSAFLANDGGKTYVYTNVHVASYEEIEFSDFRGKQVRVTRHGEVVGDTRSGLHEDGVDIVRFPVIETPEFTLRFADRQTIENKPDVWTLGDSGGERILKTLRGRIKGVGPAKIEVDCEFIPGNSGGPIVTENGEVAGIASYLKTNQSIWAKGTENEIRRIAWIPGRDFDWVRTTAAELAEERSLVEGCLQTSIWLWTILQLDTREDGFHFPENFPDEARTLLASSHPLAMNLDETHEKVVGFSRRDIVGNQEIHRIFVRFFDSCFEYQTQQLEGIESKIRSSFWKKDLDDMLEKHRQILQQFGERLERYRNQGWPGGTLGDA